MSISTPDGLKTGSAWEIQLDTNRNGQNHQLTCCFESATTLSTCLIAINSGSICHYKLCNEGTLFLNSTQIEFLILSQNRSGDM